METSVKRDSTKMEEERVSAFPIMKMVKKNQLDILKKGNLQAFGCIGTKMEGMIGQIWIYNSNRFHYKHEISFSRYIWLENWTHPKALSIYFRAKNKSINILEINYKNIFLA